MNEILIYIAIFALFVFLVHKGVLKTHKDRLGTGSNGKEYLEQAKLRQGDPFPEEDKKVNWDYMEDYLLDKKIIKEKIYIDKSLPKELIIRNSRGYLLFLPLFGFVFFILINILLNEVLTNVQMGIVSFFAVSMLAISIYIICIAVNRTPKVIINDRGIKTKDTPFFPWGQIYNEQLYILYSGKSKYQEYFIYDHPAGRTVYLLSNLDINNKTITTALRTYRKRWERSKAIFNL